MRNHGKFNVGRSVLTLVILLLATLIAFAGCQQLLGPPSSDGEQPSADNPGPEGDNGGGDDEPTNSAIVDRTLQEIGTSLHYAGFSNAEIEAIKTRAIGSLGSAATSTDPTVAIPAVVAGAEKALGSGDTDLSDIDSDPERRSAVDAIVTGAVGSIRATASGASSREAVSSSTAAALRAISQSAVEHLDDAQLDDVAEGAKVATRSMVRNLRKAGVERADLESSLDSITSGAMAGVGNAVGTDKTKMRTTVGRIAAGATAGLGEAAIDGVDVKTDLPALVRQVTSSATKSIGTTGVEMSDNDVNSVVQELTKASTSAVREALGSNADDESVSKAVREITAATAESLRDVTVGGVSVEVRVVVQYVAKGAAEGVNEMAEAGTSIDYGKVVKSAHAGVIKGASVAGETLQSEDLEELEDAVSSLQGQIGELERRLNELNQTLDAVLDEGTSEGNAAASNTAPVLVVSITGSVTGPITVGAPEEIERDETITIDASSTSDDELLAEELYYSYRVVRPDGSFATVTALDETPLGLHDTRAMFIPQFAGRYTVIVTAEDAYDSVRFLVDLVVPQVAENTPPSLRYQITDSASTSYGEGDVVAPGTELTIDASTTTDVDSGDTLSYEVIIEEPDGTVSEPMVSGAVATYVVGEVSGYYYYRVLVTDGDAVVSEEIAILANTAPTVGLSVIDGDGQPIAADATIDTGTRVTILASPSDADSNAQLSYQIGVKGPDDRSYTVVNRLSYSFTATTTGQYEFYAHVSDGLAEINQQGSLAAQAPEMSEQDKQNAFDQAVSRIEAGLLDEAYNRFASILASDPDYVPAIVGLTILDLASIVADPALQSFAVDTLGIVSYPATMNEVFSYTTWMDEFTYENGSGDMRTGYFPTVRGQVDHNGDGVFDEAERADAIIRNMMSYLVLNDAVDLFVGLMNSRIEQIADRLRLLPEDLSFTVSWDFEFDTVSEAANAGWPWVDGYSGGSVDGIPQETELLDFIIGKPELEALLSQAYLLKSLNKLAQLLDLNLDLSSFYDGYIAAPAPGEAYYVFPTDGLFSGNFLENRPDAVTKLAESEGAFLQSVSYLRSSMTSMAARSVGSGFTLAPDSPVFNGAGFDIPYSTRSLQWTDVEATARFVSSFLNRVESSVSDQTALVCPTDLWDYSGPIEFFEHYGTAGNWPTEADIPISNGTVQEPTAIAFNFGAFFGSPFGGISALLELDERGEPIAYKYDGTPNATSATFTRTNAYAPTSSGFYFIKIQDATLGGAVPAQNLPSGDVDTLNALLSNNHSGGDFYYHHAYLVTNDNGSISVYIRVPDEFAANVFVARGESFDFYRKYFDKSTNELQTQMATDISYGSFWWAVAGELVPTAPENIAPTAALSITDDEGREYSGGEMLIPGITLTLDAASSSDADGDSLRYEITVQDPEGMVTTRNPSNGIAPYTIANLSGDYVITASVFDGTDSDQVQTTLSANTPPIVNLEVVDSQGDRVSSTVEAGQELTVAATFADADSNASLSYELEIVIPGQPAQVMPGIAEHTFTAHGEGSYQVIARATDGFAAAEEQFHCTAVSPPEVDPSLEAAFDAAIDDLAAGLVDEAYNQLATIVATNANYMDAVVALSALDIAAILTDPDIQSFATDTLGLTTYPSTMNTVFEPSTWMDNIVRTDAYGNTFSIYFPPVDGQTDKNGDGLIDEVEHLEAMVNNLATHLVLNDAVDLFVGETNSRLEQIATRMNAISDEASFTISWDIVYETAGDAEWYGWPWSDGYGGGISDGIVQEEELLDFTIGKAELESLIAQLHLLRSFNKLAQTVDLSLDLSTYYDGYIENPGPGEPYFVFPVSGPFAGSFLEDRPDAATYLAEAEAAFVQFLVYLQTSSNEIAERGLDTGFTLAPDSPVFDGTAAFEIPYFYDSVTQTYDPLTWTDIQSTLAFFDVFTTKIRASIDTDTAAVLPADGRSFDGPVEFCRHYETAGSWPTAADVPLYEGSPDAPNAIAFNFAAFFNSPFGGVSAFIDLDATGEPVIYTYTGTPTATSADFTTVSSYDATNGHPNEFFYIKLKDVTLGGAIPADNIPGGTMAAANETLANNYAGGTFYYHDAFFVENGDGTVSVYVWAPDEFVGNVFVARDESFVGYSKWYDSETDSIEIAEPRTISSQGSFWWASMSSAVPTATDLDQYEADDSPATASEWYVESVWPQTHTFHSASDQDWIFFFATAGETYTIETDSWEVDTELYLYGSDGLTELEHSDPEGYDSRVQHTTSVDGVLYVLVANVGGGTGWYDLRIINGTSDTPVAPQPDPYEIDDTVSDATMYTVGSDGYQSRSFDYYGDTDWVAFSASAGTTYVIETFDFGQGADTVLHLYESDGVTEIRWDDDSNIGLYSRIEYTAITNNMLYVKIREFGNNTGEYGFEIH